MNGDRMRYEIRVSGILDSGWAQLFGGLSMHHERDCETVLSGEFPDQASLHGLLARLRDLNLILLAVNRIESPLSESGRKESGSPETKTGTETGENEKHIGRNKA